LILKTTYAINVVWEDIKSTIGKQQSIPQVVTNVRKENGIL
jgi:hypothetical protein